MDLIPKIRGCYWKSISNKAYLSNDLGAIARLCFEIGTQKMLIGKDEYLNEEERNKLEKSIEKRQRKIQERKQEDNQLSEMQFHLLKIGQSLGYDAFVASNDRSGSSERQIFTFMSPNKFPPINCDKETSNTIKLIDVLWFAKGANNVICAFEVGKSTSIYSVILRLTDLSYFIADGDEFSIWSYLIVEKRT